MHEVTRRFRETIRDWGLWGPGEDLLLAVSGGIDSMVLADLVRRLAPSERPKATVVHFNHNLRGKESDRDAVFVQETCKGWGIRCEIGKAPAWGSKNNLQERARELRYGFFRSVAEKSKIFRLATAHQADDQAETFLIRWIQGAGLKGLAGIPLVREDGDLKVVRPLLFVTREEIGSYARVREVPYREDSSNQGDAYLRNKVRRLLVELRELNPGIAGLSAINALLLRADQEFLEKAVGESFSKGDRKDCPVSGYINFPPALRYRVLQRMYQEGLSDGSPGHSLSGEFVLKLDRLIRDKRPRLSLNLPNRVVFRKDYVIFTLDRLRD